MELKLHSIPSTCARIHLIPDGTYRGLLINLIKSQSSFLAYEREDNGMYPISPRSMKTAITIHLGANTIRNHLCCQETMCSFARTLRCAFRLFCFNSIAAWRLEPATVTTNYQVADRAPTETPLGGPMLEPLATSSQRFRSKQN